MRRFASCFLLLLGAIACVPQTASPRATQDLDWAAASTQVKLQEGRIQALETAGASLATVLANHEDSLRYLATRGPANTSRTPRRTPSTIAPIEAELIIEAGRCCVGGPVGEPITIDVAIAAESPLGEVTEMRVSAGPSPTVAQAIDTAEWGPFVDGMQFTVTPPINWTAFYIAAQFRDSGGNVSRLFRADISVEGMPIPRTATPAP